MGVFGHSCVTDWSCLALDNVRRDSWQCHPVMVEEAAMAVSFDGTAGVAVDRAQHCSTKAKMQDIFHFAQSKLSMQLPAFVKR